MAGELEIRPDQFQAFVAGRSLNLTRREFELLHSLAEANGKVLEREEIYQRVWGYTMAHGDRSVDVFIRKLRSKLQKASSEWAYVHTHFGVGYRFEAEPADGDAEPDCPPSRSGRSDRGASELRRLEQAGVKRPSVPESSRRSHPFHTLVPRR